MVRARKSGTSVVVIITEIRILPKGVSVRFYGIMPIIPIIRIHVNSLKNVKVGIQAIDLRIHMIYI